MHVFESEIFCLDDYDFRNKAGMWGWRSDKSEVVNGFFCKVFGATNVELVTKTRTEHLTESDKARCRSNKTPLQNFLGIAEIEENHTIAVPTNVGERTKYCNSHMRKRHAKSLGF